MSKILKNTFWCLKDKVDRMRMASQHKILYKLSERCFKIHELQKFGVSFNFYITNRCNWHQSFGTYDVCTKFDEAKDIPLLIGNWQQTHWLIIIKLGYTSFRINIANYHRILHCFETIGAWIVVARMDFQWIHCEMYWFNNII